MTVDESVPDREALRAVAAQRLRRGRLLTVLLAPAMFLLVPVVLLLTTPGRERTGTTGLVLLMPAVVAVVVLLAVLLLARSREREPQLVAGADRPTRRAVQQALRTGHPADARIDALTRDVAADNLRRGWLLWLFAPLILLQGVVLVSRVIDGDGPGGIALPGATVAAFLLLLGALLLNRRRSRRYLAARRS